MTKISCHIVVGADPWCQWTGCQAGRDIATKTGVHTCSMPSLRIGKAVATRLAPHFRSGAVKVVRGDCPNAPIAA